MRYKNEKMKKIYGIKQKNFQKETGTMDNIGENLEFRILSENKQEVLELKKKLEVKKVRENQSFLEAFALGSPNARKIWENNGERIIQLKELYHSWFGINLIYDNDEGDWFDYQLEHLKFPNTATNEQVNLIRELLTIEFFSYYEMQVENNQKYYTVKFNKEFFPNQNSGYFTPPCNPLEIVKFENIFLEEANAKRGAAFRLYKVIESHRLSNYHKFNYGGFKGELDEISHNPAKLKMLLDKSYFIKYEKKALSVIYIDDERELFSIDLIELNELLKVPIFFIHEK